MHDRAGIISGSLLGQRTSNGGTGVMSGGGRVVAGKTKGERMKSQKRGGATRAKKRILIMDDHPVTRHGLTQLLSHESDLTIAGEVDSVPQALLALQSSPPDLFLVDLTMPGKSGLNFIREVTALHPDLKMLILSMYDEITYAERVLRAGARGYVMKTESGENLLKAIRSVLGGDFSISEKLTGVLLGNLSDRADNEVPGSLNMLTSREFEIFQLIGQGLGTRDIGERLAVSGKTVETHRMHLKEKLKLKSSSELISHAVRWAVTNQFL